jgi:AraC-like DNA-binding protein
MRMNKDIQITQTGLFFACNGKNEAVFEEFVPEHMLTHVYGGRVSVTTADKTFSLSAGQTALFARNQLVKFTKLPEGDSPYTAVTLFFAQPLLQQFFTTIPLPKRSASHPSIVPIAPHPLLANLFESIALYASLNEEAIPDELALLKVNEAITLLRMLDQSANNLLSDFSEPHKIDLANFMNKNFMFTISIPRFAYLTGRSLATFKRDFQKIFGNTPQKWLTEKRLEYAHFLIAEKRQKPSQAYIEAGFENFSHFTYAFRRLFGYTPSSISEPVNK